ncbi:PTS sugar transporter subunit IIB [Enterococcus sp. AZ196]|uniref:PTS sugar transporter subunit IIB n=1 Tax=Enterococcus sp. AZ196 TaxID=2774659 RepID=UPI003D27E4A8
MKKVIVACGTGMATSSMIAEKVRQVLEDNEVEYTLSQAQLSELDMYKEADLFVTAMRVEEDYGVPMVVGTPFLVGIGEAEAAAKIIEILKN